MENNAQSENQMREANSRLARAGGLAFSLSAVLMLVASLVFSGAVAAFSIAEDSDLYLYLQYLCAPAAMVTGIIITLKLNAISPKTVFRFKCSPKYYLIALLLIFGLLFSANYVDVPFLQLFKLMGYKQKEAGSYFPELSGGWVVLALLVIAVMPAIFEEALFRGVILNTCEQSLGSIRTIFIVGFCFALFHGSPEQTIYQFLAGCAFAFLAVRSGSILPSVLMHFINNALIVIFAACDLFDEAGNLAMPEPAFIAVTILSALCFVAATLLLILDKKPLKTGDKKLVGHFFLYASVGIAILALSWILSFIGS